MYLVQDLEEEILLRLPLRSVLRFKAVSTQWRSILESRRFAERRRSMNNVQKIRQILAVRDDDTSESQFQGDEEVEMVYIQCEAAATQPSLTCDGLICIPVEGWVKVLNPCTGQVLRFPSGPNPVYIRRYDRLTLMNNAWSSFFPGYWAMGFGKDKVNGSYKIVRLFFDTDQCEILDLNIGEWRKLPRPPYSVEPRNHSVCVNGSIYWFQLLTRFRILALDLHTQQFHDVPTPFRFLEPSRLFNLEDRLAIVSTDDVVGLHKVVIWTMDTQQETWTKTYSIPYFSEYPSPNVWELTQPRCNPLLVSKKGNFYFHDSDKRLFKYYPETDQLRCIAKHFRLLSPFVDDLVPLRHQEITTVPLPPPGLQYSEDSSISRFFRRIDLPSPTTILLTTSVVALVVFRFSSLSSRSLS